MKKKIIFEAIGQHVTKVRPKPLPASRFIPEYLKDAPSYVGNKLSLTPANATVKKCLPILDGYTQGYIVTLWADILIEDDIAQPTLKTISWNVSEPVVGAWSLEQSATFDFGEMYSGPVFKYEHGWNIITPKGYSCLITHPHGYPHSPFKTLTGVIDSDKLRTPALSPFIVKKDFTGIIEKGTPMFQVFPFRREEWEASYEEITLEEGRFRFDQLHSQIRAPYASNLRSRKTFK